MSKKKRTHDETLKAVEKVRELIKGGMKVKEALEQEHVQHSVWYKYKNTRKPYNKKTPTVSEIEPIKLTGTKTMFVITDDPEVIERMMEKLK